MATPRIWIGMVWLRRLRTSPRFLYTHPTEGGYKTICSQKKGDEALLSCALCLRLRIDQIVGRSIEGSEPVVHRLERGTKYLGTGCWTHAQKELHLRIRIQQGSEFRAPAREGWKESAAGRTIYTWVAVSHYVINNSESTSPVIGYPI